MDGKQLTRAVLDFLDEDAPSDLYANQRLIYEMLDLAAGIFCRETRILHKEIEITTVEDQQAYDLPPGFIDLYMRSRAGVYFIKFNDTSNDSFPVQTSYDRIFRSNYTTSQTVPSRFAIMDKEDKEDLIQGTADAHSAAEHGQCTLQDDSMLFTSTNKVYPRDNVHNEIDESDGYVLTVTDDTHLVTALFGGTTNDWELAQAYTIQPAAEKQIILNAPSATAGCTITIPYSAMPAPVFSEYGFWRFPPRVCKAIAAGAAALFKMPQREFTESTQIGGLFAQEITRLRREQSVTRIRHKQYKRGW
jgi:hypothetical protein